MAWKVVVVVSVLVNVILGIVLVVFIAGGVIHPKSAAERYDYRDVCARGVKYTIRRDRTNGNEECVRYMGGTGSAPEIEWVPVPNSVPQR